jgi:2-deoxy-D-gluconate 3-dehydrogenase
MAAATAERAMNLFDLTGKVALVTGGNSGIGFGMARGLAAAGAQVVLAGRNLARSEAAAAELAAVAGRALALPVDVADPASITALVGAVLDRCDRLDILVNNAGIGLRQPPEAIALADWRRVLDTNLTSAFLCSQAAYPAMCRAGGGKILMNGSMTSILGLPFAAAYGASKGGILALTRQLAAAWARDNIQVNCFLPGFIDTPLTVEGRAQIAGLDEKVVARCPAGRWGRPEDFAGVAVFLASAASDFVTGVALPVDGGYSMVA